MFTRDSSERFYVLAHLEISLDGCTLKLNDRKANAGESFPTLNGQKKSQSLSLHCRGCGRSVSLEYTVNKAGHGQTGRYFPALKSAFRLIAGDSGGGKSAVQQTYIAFSVLEKIWGVGKMV